MQILEEHRRLSKSAYEHSLAFLSQRALEPPGGPLPRVAPLPLGNATELKGMYHVVVTADGGVYGRWQTLVNYYSYQKVKAAHSRGAMGGYTRVLHADVPDDIHHLVPTVLVSPLPPGLDRGYGPMHRPWALAQWLARAHVREQYIFMTEPDHVFVAPPALRATPAAPAAYPFWYVDCRRAAYAAQCARRAFNEKGVLPDFVATIGNSPTVIAKAQLAAMLPRWDRVVRAMHADGEADAALGWAQEMFAFALALTNTGATPPHVTMQPELMAQPPFGGRLTLDKCAEKPARVCQAPEAERTVDVSIIHYTYGQDYDERGNTTYGRIGPWHWDKRDWGAAYPLLPIPRPPAGAPESVVRLVELIEEAGRSAQYQLWWLANMPQA